jgi:hypothetical protein
MHNAGIGNLPVKAVMERSTARVFAIRQRRDLRAVSGRGTKVESALVVIPGYRSTDLGYWYGVRCEMPNASWLLSPVMIYSFGTCGSLGLSANCSLSRCRKTPQKP